MNGFLFPGTEAADLDFFAVVFHTLLFPVRKRQLRKASLLVTDGTELLVQIDLIPNPEVVPPYRLPLTLVYKILQYFSPLPSCNTTD